MGKSVEIRGLDAGTEVRAFAAAAALLVVAGGLVAAVNSAAPFEHGSWLAAYLVLVGGVAQFALGVGPLALPGASGSPRLARAQLALWNLGIAAVALGVFVDRQRVVLAGSAVVLAALACFAAGAGPVRPGRVLLYWLAIGALAISVLIGCILATI
ncbi:MAG TPA: hypothetical protein VNS09_19575 [Solirubrobacter sp.]|nr:hypothetical protein [Solirubrobacter sp.]